MQIPILSGIYADERARFRESYPVNLEPVLVDSGLSKGYLATASGITGLGDGLGADRGGVLWEGAHYRVMGSRFVRVGASGDVTDLGNVGFSGPVSFTSSFDRLAIASGGRLYYWNGSTLVQVTDPDLGAVLDVVWVDGRFMTTDGEYLVVTELNDPMAVDPLRYGSSEVSPDPINGLIDVRGEVYAVNRYTIENFRNVGGTGFPFQRNPGAMIPKGAVGTHAKAPFIETFAFVGGGKNEAISVWIAGGGEALPISTPEVDDALAALSEGQQAALEIESRRDRDEERLYIHLPDRTLVYMHKASQQNGSPVWHYLAAGSGADKPWPIRHLTLIDGKWIGGTDEGALGYLDDSVETQFGALAGWRFDTSFIYNGSRGGIAHSIELVGLPGRAPFGEDPVCFLSVTRDGETWSNERALSTGQAGQRRKRIQWRPHARFDNYMGIRFRGAGTAMSGWARCEAEIEGLNG